MRPRNHNMFTRTADDVGRKFWLGNVDGMEMGLPLERAAIWCEICARSKTIVSFKSGCSCL